MKTLQSLNNKKFKIEDFRDALISNCSIILEIGIAEKNNFIYLDENQIEKVLKIINKSPLPIIDLFCVICYYKSYTTRKKPLKFDYYLLRFVFNSEIEIKMYHERGPKHVFPDDIIDFIICKINKEAQSKILHRKIK